MTSAIADHPTSRMFYFDNPKEGTYFWKQFLAGVFMVIATTGLDQDMTRYCNTAQTTKKRTAAPSIFDTKKNHAPAL